MKIFVILIISALAIYVEATNGANNSYCRNDLCSNDTIHVACTTEEFEPPNPVLFAGYVDLNPYIDMIVKHHNQVRNYVASGSGPHAPAARMGSMAWSEELAEVARYNAKSCNPGYDKCHNTEKFRNSGQIFVHHDANCLPDSSDSDRVHWAVIQLYAKNDTGFRLIVKENNTHVGCAAVKYRDFSEKANDCLRGSEFYMVCNYATDTTTQEFEYTTTSPDKIAEGCLSGVNPHRMYPHLCSFQEKYVF